MVEALAYFDTSLVVPLYRSEPLTVTAEALQQQYHPVISLLTEVELAATVARWVRTRELTEDQGKSVDKTFAEDLRLNVFERAEPGEREYWRARTWLQQRSTSLRTLDALHLAVAAENGWPLMTADRQLHQAARALHIETHWAQATQPR